MWVPCPCRGLGWATCGGCSKPCVPSLGSDSLSRTAACLLTSLPTTGTGELRWLKTEVAKNSPFPEPALQPRPVLAAWLPSRRHNPCIPGGFSAPWPRRGAEQGPGRGRMRVGTSQHPGLPYLPSGSWDVPPPQHRSVWGSQTGRAGVPSPFPRSLLHPSLSLSPLGGISPPGGLAAPLLLPPSRCPRCSAAVPGCAAALGSNQALPVPGEPRFKKRRKGKNTLKSFGKHGRAGPVSILGAQGPSCLLWGVFPLWNAPCHPPQPWVTDPSPAFPPSFPVLPPGRASRAGVSP